MKLGSLGLLMAIIYMAIAYIVTSRYVVVLSPIMKAL